MKKSAGTVQVQNKNGRLRLFWTWLQALGGDGQRKYLSLGLDDTPANRRIAEARAKQIESDLHNRCFDPTLEKYGKRVQPPKEGDPGTVTGLYAAWLEYKIQVEQIEETTTAKYLALKNALKDYFGDTTVEAIGEVTASRFRDLLSQSLAPSTLRERMTMLKSCWDWGRKKKLIPTMIENPWEVVAESVKKAPTQGAKPFTKDEMKSIVNAFRNDQYYAFYTDFVIFKFATGVRTGEALALQWKHFSEDLTSVWIGESINTKGKRKSTKTRNAGSFPLPEPIVKMLHRRRPKDYDPEDLVFPGKKGGHLAAATFSQNAWKTILDRLGLDYRRPYLTRKSFVSNAVYVDKLSAEQVARVSRHDPRVLVDHYLDGDVTDIVMPNMFGDEDLGDLEDYLFD